MRSVSYTPVSAPASGARKYGFGKTAQELAIEECQRVFTAPFGLAPHGSRVRCPQFDSLVKHVRYGDNKAPETLMKLAFGYKSLGISKSANCGMFLHAASIVAAQYPSDVVSIEDLNVLETELQGDIDRYQTRLWKKDYSAKTLKETLDGLYKMRDVIDRMIEWVEKRLYGAKQ